jgi:predicted phage tail protein
VAVGEGEIESVSEVKINENPITNYTGIEASYRYGTNDQTVIPNFEDLHNLYSIGSNLTQGNPYTYTTIDNDVEAFEIYLTLPSGLYQVDSTDGSLSGWSVTYLVEYRVSGVGGYISLGSTTISGLSRTAIRRVFRKEDLSPARYDIKVTKTSADSTLDPQRTGDLTLASIDEIKTDDLKYPNTALLGLRALATDQLSGSTPNITYVVKGRKVSMPRVLTGIGGTEVDWEDYYWDSIANEFKKFSDDSSLYWDGTTYVNKWGANPMWCVKDLLLNTRYGLGEYIDTSHIDENELLEMAKYCEEKIDNGIGGYEKRFRLDVVLDSSSRAPDALAQLTATFRSFAFYSQNGFSFRIDKQDTAVQTFGAGNIIKNEFQQSWKSKNEIYNMIEVQYMDRDLDYQDETIAVIDESSLANNEPLRKTQIRLFTTRKSYAIREGRYALWLSKYIDRSLQFKVGIDGVACQVGDIINLSHDVPQWGFSGRVKEGNSITNVKLDREILIEEGKSYKVMVRFQDNTIEERTVTDAVGSHTEVNVSVAFSQIPQDYDVYSFGESTKVTKPFRVISIARESRGEASIGAVEYNESVYDDSGIVLPTNNYSALSREIPDVVGLNLTESLVKLKDGTIESTIDVWFTKPNMAGFYVGQYTKAQIYLSDDGGVSWQYKGETSGESFKIIGGITDLSEYKIAVVSIGNLDKQNSIADSPQQTITVLGKTIPPSDVTSFLINQDRDRLKFGWTAVPDVDLWGYEIRRGDSWIAGEPIAFVTGNSYLTTDIRLGIEQSYWIKALDTSANYSTNPLEAVVTVESVPYKNIIVDYSEQTAWAGDKVNTETDGDNLIISAGQLSGTYTTPERDIGFVATFSMLIEVITALNENLRFDSSATRRFDDSTTLRWTGEDIAGGVAMEIKTSEDNITWTDWTTFQKGDYNCRYFQLRMTLTREAVDIDLICSQFNYFADLPDINEKGSDEVTVAGDGKAIVFEKIFHQEPSVHIEIRTGTGIYSKFTAKDISGFTVKLYDVSGTAVTGEFDWHAYGV